MGENEEYTAIKVEGISHWLWFKSKNIVEESGRVVGKMGWGKGGSLVEIDTIASNITGRICSTRLQHD